MFSSSGAFRIARNLGKITYKRFGGGHAHHGPSKWDAANKEFGIELHEPSIFHKGAANSLLLLMWLWVMYRIREDKGKMLVSSIQLFVLNCFLFNVIDIRDGTNHGLKLIIMKIMSGLK